MRAFCRRVTMDPVYEANFLLRARAGMLPAAVETMAYYYAIVRHSVLFAFDVLHCPRCGGRRRIAAVHTRPETLRPLLERLGFDVSAAGTRLSRAPPTPAA